MISELLDRCDCVIRFRPDCVRRLCYDHESKVDLSDSNSERMMKPFEYMALIFSIETQGFLSRTIAPGCRAGIERTLNALGREGWELTGVFPFTNGSSPAQICDAVHYFRRPLQAEITGESSAAPALVDLP